MITFTSHKSTPQAGDWNGIKFFNTAVDAVFDNNNDYINGSVVRYSRIAYAGGVIGSYIALDGNQMSLYADNNIIEYNKRQAISVNGLRSKITNNKILNNNLDLFVGDCGNAVIQIFSNNNYIKNNIVDNNGIGGLRLNSSNNNLVVNNKFANNACGIKVYGSNNEIRNNSIVDNSRMGIYYYGGSIPESGNMIRNNNITNNDDVGMFLYEYNNGGGVEITNNNIFNNTNYDFKLDDGSIADIAIPNNYWGTTDTSEIGEKIYDYYDDIEKGKVIYEPIAISEISDAGVQ